MKRKVTNLPSSVKDRLRNHARQAGETFNQILIYYALERFLYRLSRSPASDKFVLKGALLMLCWPSGLARATSDIDLSVSTKLDIDTISKALKEICQASVEPDGIEFDANSLETEFLTAGGENPGIRSRFWAYMDKTKIRMRIDIGFGDPITPDVELVDYPTILPMPAPRLISYPKETVIAEKFHAIVRLGEINSRMKDFFDIWHMIQEFEFDGAVLALAIQRTFRSRNTPIPAESPLGLSPEFARENQSAWEIFLRGIEKETVDLQDFEEILSGIRAFVLPILQSVSSGIPNCKVWSYAKKWD